MLSYPRYRVHAIVFGGLAIWPTLVLQSALSPPAGPDQSAERRMALMGDAWELFLRAPALGSGPGSFEGFWSQRYNYPIELAAPPHSLLHELLSEYGLFVTVPLALSLAVVAVRAIRPMLSRNGADVQSFIGPSWIPALILAALLPSSVIAAPWFWIWLAGVIAIQINQHQSSEVTSTGITGRAHSVESGSSESRV
ncbi:O-antigen ligase family protein [Barrientosiimonas endolithica]|nr:O-antigen ligase family protein [Barrientosiimonas endolithica]